MTSPLLAVLLLTPVLGWGASLNADSTSAAGLKLGAGARAGSMGEAQAAAVEGAEAMYWNPAALTLVERRAATFMHAATLAQTSYEYAALAHALSSGSALGVSIQYLSYGSLTETDDATGADVGTFKPHDLVFSAGYARKLRGLERLAFLEGASLGFTGKFVHSKILGSDGTLAIDLGALSPALWDGRLRLAFTATNIGDRLKFDDEASELPMALRLGGSYRLTGLWLAALDVALPNDRGPYVAFGTEYSCPVREGLTASGRVGLKTLTLGDVDGVTGFSFGVGLAYQSLGLDYGVAPFGGLGFTHRVSLSYKF